MNKSNKKFSPTRKFLLAQAVFVIFVLGFVYLYNSPKAISPIAGKTISEPDFVFEIENGDTVIVSRDPDFRNPIILEEGVDVTLPPGTYYWKVDGWLRDSEVYTFTIESSVGLNLREGEENDLLENSGNVDLNVEESKSGITTSAGLDAGKSVEVEKGGDFVGKENA